MKSLFHRENEGPVDAKRVKIQHPFVVGLVGTLGVGVGLLIITAVTSLATVLTWVGVALFIALGLEPLVSWLVKHSFPRWAAIITVLIGVLAVFVGFLFTIVPVIVEQANQFILMVPDIVSRLVTTDWIDSLNSQLGGFVNVHDVIKSIGEFFSNSANLGTILGGALEVGVAIANGFFGIFIVLILTLYFTASLNSMKKAAYQLVPASKRERFADISEQITQAVGRYVIGQVSLALINGVLSFVFLSIIRAQLPAVFAFVAFLFSLLPLVGTLTGSIIIVLAQLLLVLGSPLTALVAAIYYFIYMQIEAYVLSPHIMRRAVSIPGAIVVVAALAGGTLLGPLGALVAIPLAAAALLIIRQVVLPRQDAR